MHMLDFVGTKVQSFDKKVLERYAQNVIFAG
jgi:hypothetical protein